MRGDRELLTSLFDSCRRKITLRGPLSRRGFTLLEMILALGLTALVLVLISQAVHLHLSVFNNGQNEVEQPQVARSVLRYIAADLRNAVRSTAADAAGGGQAMATASSGSSGNANAPTASQGTAGSKTSTGSSGAQKSTGTKNASTTKSTSANTGANTNADAASSAQPVDVAGLYGSQYELQIDVSRPPRVDQYTSSASSGTGAPLDLPSDVKTVSYFLKTGGVTGTSGGTGSTGSEGMTGLYRREQDRAVTSYASKGSGGSAGGSGSGDGTSGSGNAGGQLLAPEVNRLEFRYFDGTNWVTDWDSQTQGGLPLAVEITLGIDPTVGVSAGASSAGAATSVPGVAATNTDEFTYRLVVRVPVAEPLATSGASTSNNSQGGLEP